MDSEERAVRRARAEDAAAVWPLVRDFAVSYEPEQRAFEHSFTDLLSRPDTLVAVADEGGSIIGYLLASCHGTFFANGPVAWVEEVMVAEAARGSGVGRALMTEAERWARSVPCAHMALASRRAGDFYDALGYEPSATYFRKTFAPTRTRELTLRNPAPRVAHGTSRAGTRRAYAASMADQETDFPKGIGAPATRALVGAGYNRLSQLAGVSVTELKKLHGMGPKALRVLQEALEEEGQSLG
jgi:GNAT superfamily N-acetyltransferase